MIMLQPTLAIWFLMPWSVILASGLVRPRNDRTFDEFSNPQSDSPLCTMAEKMSEPCESSQIRRTISIHTRGASSSPVPSECTCNNEFYTIWSACLLSAGNSAIPRYDEWGDECQKSSLSLKDGYPSQWRTQVDIPTWASTSVPTSQKFDYTQAMIVARSEDNGWTKVQIIILVVSIVGAFILAALAMLLIKSSSSKKKIWLSEIMHWLRPRHVNRIYKVKRARRTSTFSIDRDGTDEFVMVDHEETQSYKSHLSSSDTLDTLDPRRPTKAESHFPGKAIWKNSQFAQQLRRLPDQLPIPFKNQAIEVKSIPAYKRFRVDSSDASTESTRLSMLSDPHSYPGTADNHGGGRPDTILEDDEDEGTALISPTERSDNDIFLISRRPGIDFTLESGSSNSRSSHPVRIIPPTPTESSRYSPVQTRATPAPPLRPVLPPAPKKAAPAPPPMSIRIPPQLQRLSQESIREARGAPLPPQITVQIPQQRPSQESLRQIGPEILQPTLMHPSYPSHPRQQFTPQTSSESIPRVPVPIPLRNDLQPVRRQRSVDDTPAVRPMGARLPHSPGHSVRQLSIDEELGPHNPSPSLRSINEAYMPSPAHSHIQLPPHRRGYSDDTSSDRTQALSAPRHNRSISAENVIPGRGDPVMLFPGSVRGAGYMIGIPAASESSASLYSNNSLPRSLSGATKDDATKDSS